MDLPCLVNEPLSNNERAKIQISVGEKQKKKLFQSQRPHVDLVPNHDLPNLLGDPRGREEQNKDHQIALLEWVLKPRDENTEN